MKVVIIAGLLSFVLAIAATIFFNGFLNGNNSVGNDQQVNGNAQNVVSEQGELEEAQKKIVQAKQELEEQKSEIAKEKMKLEKMKTHPVEPEKPTEEDGSVNNGTEIGKENISQAGLKQAAKLFASMKPTEAAVILCELDENLTKRIISEMDTRSAGKVMSALAESNPAYAAKVSKAMLNTGRDISF